VPYERGVHAKRDNPGRPRACGRFNLRQRCRCRGPQYFRRCAPALARHFLPRGRLGFLIDSDMEAMLSHYVEGKEPR
jgi:hypothetical protein